MRYITLVLITIFAMRFTATFQDETDEKQCSQRIGDVGFSSHTIPIEAGVVGAADFNNDGQADLVNGGEPELTIMLGDGEGMFEVFSRVPGGEEPSDFALVDLNEDGSVDIVIANHDTNYLTILLGSGDGTFQPAKHSPLEISVSPHPHVVSAADLDMDGHADLLVDHRDGEGVLILRGLGDGSVQLPGILAVGDGDPYLGMAIGDVNEDGKLDIVTPNPSEVAVLVNTSEGQIAFSPPSFVAADTPFGVELGDFNGDGSLDLLTASGEGSPLVELFTGDGQGNFEEATDSPYQLGRGGKNIAVGDFNGDGITDGVVSSYFSADVLVLLGGRESIEIGYLPASENPWGLAIVDLNNDGSDDLIVADDQSGGATIYLSAGCDE